MPRIFWSSAGHACMPLFRQGLPVRADSVAAVAVAVRALCADRGRWIAMPDLSHHG